jgi:hypothetical protein
VKEYTSWSQIRGKKKKDFFINRYIDYLSNKYNLTLEEKRNLHDQVHFGYCLKIIDTNNITLKDMEITDIDNLIWDEEKRKFELNGEPKYKKSSRKRTLNEPIPKNSSLYMWLKYVSKITGVSNNLCQEKSHEDTTDVDNMSTTL